jgi:hypothetical protein
MEPTGLDRRERFREHWARGATSTGGPAALS